ncbi:MAG: XRE family transcriptional regulator [Clostridia bacterium]|nr:XRE family transcriptional regulator [Clostridia bacterium]
MYANLELEMIKANVNKRMIANALHIHENSVLNKFSGKTPFTIAEAFETKKQFFPDLDLDYLFATE